MVSMNLLVFKLLSEQGLYAQSYCDLDFWPTNFKIKWEYLWVMAIRDTKKDKPGWNKFKVNELTDR